MVPEVLAEPNAIRHDDEFANAGLFRRQTGQNGLHIIRETRQSAIFVDAIDPDKEQAFHRQEGNPRCFCFRGDAMKSREYPAIPVARFL